MMCPFCGKSIYSRTRPKTNERILLTEEGLKKIEEGWTKYALSNKWFEVRKKLGISEKDYLKTQETLRQKFGCFPFITDVFWSLFNELLLDCCKKGDFKKENLIKEKNEKIPRRKGKKDNFKINSLNFWELSQQKI